MGRERDGAELTESSNQLHPRDVHHDLVGDDDDGDDNDSGDGGDDDDEGGGDNGDGDDDDDGVGDIFAKEATCECEAPDTWPVIVPEAPKRLQIVFIIVRYLSTPKEDHTSG